MRQADPVFKAHLKTLRDGIQGEAELRETIQYWNERFLEFNPIQRERFLEKLTVFCFPTRAKVQECNLANLHEFDHVVRAPCHLPTKTWRVQARKGKQLGAVGAIPREFYGAIGCLIKLTAKLHDPWGQQSGLLNGAIGERSLTFSMSRANLRDPLELPLCLELSWSISLTTAARLCFLAGLLLYQYFQYLGVVRRSVVLGSEFPW